MSQLFTKKDFGPPPPGYKPGVGRGAVGFTTRSDIGPAHRIGNTSEPQNENISYDDSQFDKFSGYSHSLFSGVSADQEDIMAEKVYKAIDQRMDSKRKARREALEKELENITLDVYERFKEDKKELAKLSLADWASIPEAGQHTKRPKTSSRKEKFTPVPDFIIHSAHESAQQNIDKSGTITPFAPTPVSGTATPVNITQLGMAREKVLDMTLGKLSDSVDGQTVVDPKGYLTDLKSQMFSSDSDVSDIEKARLLFKSITATNPSSAPGWVGAARLEEYAGKQALARKLILQGCEECPSNEDVWIEAARLHRPKMARSIIARAVSYIPQSIKLWTRAMKLEQTVDAKRTIVRKALELIPNSLELWKAAIELEDSQNAKILLSKAVRCVPKSVELWLALARLENHGKARQVLNEARQHLPAEPRVWMAAARLEEANGAVKTVPAIVAKGIRSLRKHGVVIDRDFWIREAYSCEEAQSPETCAAVIECAVGEGIDRADRRNTWLADAESASKLGHVITARAIFRHLLEDFPETSAIWIKAAKFEKEKGDYNSLCKILNEALENCPNSEEIILLLSEEQREHGNIEESKKTLKKAIDEIVNSEKICLAAAELEFQTGQNDVARKIFNDARKNIESPRIWLKSAILERELKNLKKEEKLLEKGTEKFKNFPKLWLMMAQCYERKSEFEKAASAYRIALKNNQKSESLWKCYAEFESRNSTDSKARSILETARIKIPKSPTLWLASIRLEAKSQPKIATRMLSKALQECPASGELWAFAVEFEPRPKRKGRCHDALKALPENYFVYLAAAKIFWAERKVEKAKNWLERAVKANSKSGDAWAYYYAFTSNLGTTEQQKDIENRCALAQPKMGELWISVSKKVGNRRLGKIDILKKVAAQIKV